MGFPGKKSIKGQAELRDEVKTRVTMALTPTAANLLKQKAKANNSSVSETVEEFARQQCIFDDGFSSLGDRLRQTSNPHQYEKGSIPTYINPSEQVTVNLDTDKLIASAIASLKEREQHTATLLEIEKSEIDAKYPSKPNPVTLHLTRSEAKAIENLLKVALANSHFQGSRDLKSVLAKLIVTLEDG